MCPLRVAFIHGRPGPHPFHAALADSVSADSFHVDRLLRWHDRDPSLVRLGASWLLNAAFFPDRGAYDAFVTEGPHAPPVLMRKLGLLRASQRTIALMDNEALYFIRSRRYSPRSRRLMIWLLRSFDSLICIGAMQAGLAREMVAGVDRNPAVFECPSALPESRRESLSRLQPALAGAKLVFVGHGVGGIRVWYKGLDLLLGAVQQALPAVPDLELEIVGEWDREVQESLAREFPVAAGRTRFTGPMKDINAALRESALYVHLGRGEAFGISILEAMMGGVPALVSEWTGAAEAVRQVGEEWVVPLDATAAASRIVSYLQLSVSERLRLSRAGRDVASGYTEERARSRFRTLVGQIAAAAR